MADIVMSTMDTAGVMHIAYYRSGSSAPYLVQRVEPLRADDYPVLMRIWENDADDGIFTDEPAQQGGQ